MPPDAVPSPSLPSRLVRLALWLAPVLVPVGMPAQPLRTLARPDAEFAEPFTAVGGIRELKDGHVVVIDPRDKIVQVVDLATGAATKVGREGSGPGEYAFPMRLVPLPGDSSAVYDMLNSRLLVVLPSGKAGPFITVESDGAGAAGGPRGGMMRVGGAATRYADARGRLYWTGQPITMPEPGGGPPKMADSVPVLRYDRATKRIDTVAFTRVAKNNAQVSGGSGNVRMMIGMANPFAPRDEWAVAPDGRVAVLRSPEYRVDWYGPNGKTSGAPIAYEKLPVTEAHKAEWRESRKQMTAVMVTVDNGQRSVRTGPPDLKIPDPGNWPEAMPPFLDNAVQVAPNGMVWVARTGEAGAPARYDVIDGAGKVVMRVALPARVRLVGLGAGTAYAVRTDEDDLQYLQRYRVP